MNNEFITFSEFLNLILKKKNISVIEFMQKIGEKNKTTIYRILQGESGIESIMKIKEMILSTKVFQLTEYEMEEMEKAISVSKYGKDVVEGRTRLIQFLTSTNKNSENNEEIKISYFGNSNKIDSMNEIFDKIKLICEKGDITDIKILILNSTHNNIFTILSNFVDSIKMYAKTTVDIEHIIQFFDNKIINVEMLDAITKLLCNINYKPFYEPNYLIKYEENKILEEFIIVKVSSDSVVNSHLFKISNSAIYMYTSSDEMLFNLYSEYFYSLKRNCTSFTNVFVSDNFIENLVRISQYFENLERDNTVYSLKPDPCYPLIDKNILEKMGDLFIKEQFSNADTSTVIEATKGKDLLIQSLRSREHNLKNKNGARTVDVFSKQGLERFIYNRELSDHIKGMAKFDLQDVRKILEDILNMNNDPSIPYEFFVLKNNLLHEDFMLEYIKGVCINLNVFDKKYISGYKDTIIASEIFIQMFDDFFENEVFVNLVMGKEESAKYLQGLIKAII